MNVYALELARLPNATLKLLLRLAKTLRRDTPEKTNEVIDEAAEDVDWMIALVENALTARLAAANKQLLTSESDFDYAVDGLWILLRRLLEATEAYTHRGLDALPPKLAQAADLDQLRERAKSCRKLWERLFAADGTTFTKLSYMVQAESMATLLRLIEQHDLRPELEAAVGPELVRLLEVCQVHYEDMVSDRMTRQTGVEQNLNDLRTELRCSLIGYVNAILTLYKRKQPESGKVVLEALRAIITLRDLMARSGSEAEVEAELEEFVELDLPEGADEALADLDEAEEDEG